MNLCCHIVKTTKDKRELKRHGSSEFPLARCYLIGDRTPSTTIDWHRHEEFEIIYIRDGECRIKNARSSYGGIVSSNGQNSLSNF